MNRLTLAEVQTRHDAALAAFRQLAENIDSADDATIDRTCRELNLTRDLLNQAERWGWAEW